MATNTNIKDILLEEFEKWQESTSTEDIFLLESNKEDDGCCVMTMLLGGEHEFKLRCPSGYPQHCDTFFVSADSAVSIWANSLNEFLLDAPKKVSLQEALNKALFLYASKKNSTTESVSASEDDMSIEEDDLDEDVEMILSDDDSAYTTEWELKVARKKKRWAQKEFEIREELKKSLIVPGSFELGAVQASGQEREQAKQIFTTSAASGILTNDLVKIMECAKDIGFNAEPVDDNIYQWHVTLYNFDISSPLAKDLHDVNEKFGYDCIELQLDFAIDLYPFYPPLVKVIRPRLQDSMMQRVTNMELLKLSYWNPAKDMLNVLIDIRSFLQQWARLEVLSERNDKKRYPNGSYVDIEHHLLRLALVSEVNPRANIKFQLAIDKPPDIKPPTKEPEKKKDEYWASGVGFGHNKRSGWDINAYVAAQREKDKQVESVLHKIHKELKVLYHNHAPQLKPKSERNRLGVDLLDHKRSSLDSDGSKNCSNSTAESSNSIGQSSRSGPMDCGSLNSVQSNTSASSGSTETNESVDPVEDMYNILEGSALVPFLEQYLKADSFLEICRHTSVYKAIVDIIKELAMQAQLLPLCGPLPDQSQSLYQLLQHLEQKATTLLQHICKAGNGSIPKPRRGIQKILSTSSKKGKHHKAEKEKNKEEKVNGGSSGSHTASAHNATTHLTTSGHPDFDISSTIMEKSAEERLAREFQVLFKDVTEAFNRTGISPEGISESESGSSDVTMEVVVTIDENLDLESRYKKLISELQFLQTDIDCEGSHSHHYNGDYKKQPPPSQKQVFRIAQEYSSLATSLPLNLCSSVCIRTDDEKLTLARALITGPEGTPYSSGCFVFDIFFPPTYPKTPPLVNLQTTGGGTVRFNPNLYNCGKVCLSLLGTWEGQQGEQWNEVTSTLLQVLVSIQSLILVPEPYFNEPGYEQEIGTDAGNRFSSEYNLNVQINNIKHAMLGQLHDPSPGFEDVIRTHFYLKRDRIIQEVDGWVKNCKSSKLDRVVFNLKQELLRLQPPANVVNLAGNNSMDTGPFNEEVPSGKLSSLIQRL